MTHDSYAMTHGSYAMIHDSYAMTQDSYAMTQDSYVLTQESYATTYVSYAVPGQFRRRTISTGTIRRKIYYNIIFIENTTFIQQYSFHFSSTEIFSSIPHPFQQYSFKQSRVHINSILFINTASISGIFLSSIPLSFQPYSFNQSRFHFINKI